MIEYRLWEEGQAPCFVLETTSASTLREDKDKRKTYEQLGVDEYFQFDPEGDYLKPRLQGLRLVDGRYREVQAEPDGSLLSQATGVLFRADGCELRLTDAATGAPILREEEEAEALSEAEGARRKAEEERRNAQERVRVLEEELARLRRTE